MLEFNKFVIESTTLFSRNDAMRCSQCGTKGHSKEKCWTVIGYPSWHPRHKKFPQKKKTRASNNPRGRDRFNNATENKTAANVQMESSNVIAGYKGDQSFTLTEQQYEQLMRLIPQ